ncbi:MAG: META domain-containing protein [Ilumatobacter sp.]
MFAGLEKPSWTSVAFVAGPVLFFVVILVVALNQSDDAAIEGTEWKLDMIQVDGELSPVIEGSTTSLTLDGGTASGSGGCNSYQGAYELDGDALAFAPMAATLMLCVDPPGADEQEANYFAHLSGVDSVEVADGELMLSSSSDVLLVFVAADQ